MSALTILRASARNNAWANHRLYGACAKLSHEELREERTAFFPTIMKTLNHILIVDWYYVDALVREGQGRSVFDKGEETFTDFVPLRVAQRAVDMKLLKFVESTSDEKNLETIVEIQRLDHVQRETVTDVLLHLYEHQIHHRGQVHAMLSGTSVEPPQLDEFFLREELPLRQKDLEELGLPLL